MKRALITLSVFLALLATGAHAQNAPQPSAADPDAVRRCQSFSECTLVWGGCADMAINKAYMSQFKPVTACAQSAPHNPEALPTCTDGLCVVVAPDQKQ